MGGALPWVTCNRSLGRRQDGVKDGGDNAELKNESRVRFHGEKSANRENERLLLKMNGGNVSLAKDGTEESVKRRSMNL